MRYIQPAIAIQMFCATGSANPQTTAHRDLTLGHSASAATATFTSSENGKKCRGRLAGRCRVYFSDPVTFCMVKIKRDGTISRRSSLTTSCRGVRLDHSPVLDGTMETMAGILEIFEAFISKGSGNLSGVGIYLDGFASVVTGTRYQPHGGRDIVLCPAHKDVR